jgi:hypothetical protein
LKNKSEEEEEKQVSHVHIVYSLTHCFYSIPHRIRKTRKMIKKGEKKVGKQWSVLPDIVNSIYLVHRN